MVVNDGTREILQKISNEPFCSGKCLVTVDKRYFILKEDRKKENKRRELCKRMFFSTVHTYLSIMVIFVCET